MVTKQHYGIKGLYKYIRQELPKDQLIEESVDAEIVHERNISELQHRNSAGAIGRANKYAHKKRISSDIHAKLKAQLGKNPPLKILVGELSRTHPDIEWKDGGVKDWWTKLNKGQPI
jgi:hypothetical protein